MNTAPESDARSREENANALSLVILNGPRAGSVMRLSPGRLATIGRNRNCTLPLDDPLIAPVHASIWQDGETWRVENEDDANTTFVNSRQVEDCDLRPGDLLRLGEQMMVLSSEESCDDDDAQAVGPAGPRRIFSTTPRERLEAGDDDPDRKLERIYSLTACMLQAPDLDSLIDCALQALRHGIEADVARFCPRDNQGETRTQTARCSGGPDVAPQFLAAWAIRRDEAMCIELNDVNSVRGTIESSDRGTAIGAPVPGVAAPRGALECLCTTERPHSDRADLDFVISVARLLGMAWENLEQTEQRDHARRRNSHSPAPSTRILGNSPAIRDLRAQIARVAPTDSTVLVLGESGTGKELVAKEIHSHSGRADGPFVAVNCAAYNDSLLESELFGHEKGAFTGADRRHKGQFERADRGTILLDEVGELSAPCQAKLLRLLEGQPFERVGGVEPVQVCVRIVAATNRNLLKMVRSGAFREDLWYRLHVIELRTPPLRARGDDVVELAHHFLENSRLEIGRGPRRFSASADDCLRNHDWPGNIRELRNAVERAVVLETGDEVTPESLRLASSAEQSAGETSTLAEMELRHIENVLAMVGGNKSEACRILGIGRATLYSKLNRIRG